MVEVNSQAFNSTSENLSGWLVAEEDILPAIQKGIEDLIYDKLTPIESIIYNVYILFLNGDI